MARGIPKSARAVAIDALNRFDPRGNYAGTVLNALLHQTTERQRATDLVFGTIRNRHAIDVVIVAFSSTALERISSKLLNIIRIAVYELVYRPGTPDYSIVNDAVENAKILTGARPAGFVNAILRKITRRITNRRTSLSQAEIRAVLPQDCDSGCEFDAGFLPDARVRPADYFSAAFSLPKWLVEDWLAQFGLEKARQVCFASNRRPSVYLRANSLKTTTEELAQKLRAADIEFEIVRADMQAESSMIRLKGGAAVTQLPGFAEGLFAVQDPTASHAVRLLNPRTDSDILDLCAAPGTKTTQLVQATGDSARIIATDIDGERLKMVEENVTRLGAGGVEIVAYENLESRLRQVGGFDAILLDVPCSNTGVLAKRIEVRYRLNPDAIKQLASKQGELLGKAAGMLKPGGKICYSTCSLQESENSEIVGEFLRQNGDFELEGEQLVLPTCENHGEEGGGWDHDGGYVAVIVRKSG